MSVLSAEHYIELRCPLGPKALLAKVIQQGDSARRTESNLLELTCRDCCRTARKTNPNVERVLHRFDIFGELIESVIQD